MTSVPLPAPESLPTVRSHVTLVLCMVLHGFTHAYGTMLVPLYLLVVQDFQLSGVKRAALVVTIYGVVYCLGSYAAGVLADRFDRRLLLGIGLIGNALAIIGMGLTRQYEMLVLLAVCAGVFGTLFHPAANALIPAHYPKSPGMAIGLLGIGSGLGFFAGPQFAGWRAESATWTFGLVADWQRPLVEAGVVGLLFGFIFLLVAREARPTRRAADGPRGRGEPLGPTLRARTIAIASVLGCRDFAGVATITLASIYLQKAHGLSVKQTGFILGTMMLLSTVVNPLAVYLTPGKRRLPALSVILIASAGVIALTPHVRLALVLPVLTLFQTLQLSSYAISDAAMLERVDPNHRGRIIGLFLTIAGTGASMSPWVMGFWTDMLGVRATVPEGYALPFASLGMLMLIASASTPLIARLGKAHEPTRPSSEIMPGTVGPLG